MPPDECRYRLLTSRLVTPVIRELWLQAETTALVYLPGQYVLLGDLGYRLPPRSYSIANAPRPDGQISLLVTRMPNGPTSSWVHDQLHPGDSVMLTGPYGTFTLDLADHGPVLLLAAGSGLAPVRALAEALLEAGPHRPTTLFFSARTRADTIDHERFLKWSDTLPQFHYLVTLTRDPPVSPHPRVPELLGPAIGDLHGWQVFASGPTGFVTGCAKAALALGAEPVNVHTEEFFSDPQPWTGAPPPAPVKWVADE